MSFVGKIYSSPQSSNMKTIPATILYVFITIIGCKEDPQKLENKRIQKIQDTYKNQIKSDYVIAHSYSSKEEAVIAFVNEINQNKNPESICNEKESKEILFPNSYNSNSLISFEEPDRAWELVFPRRNFALDSLKNKLPGTTINEIKIIWNKEVRDLNSLKGHVVQKIHIRTNSGMIELEEIKLIIEHKSQFKVCVVSR